MRYLDKLRANYAAFTNALALDIENNDCNVTHGGIYRAAKAALAIDIALGDWGDADDILDAQAQEEAKRVAQTLTHVIALPHRHILTREEERAADLRGILDGAEGMPSLETAWKWGVI